METSKRLDKLRKVPYKTLIKVTKYEKRSNIAEKVGWAQLGIVLTFYGSI